MKLLRGGRTHHSYWPFIRCWANEVFDFLIGKEYNWLKVIEVSKKLTIDQGRLEEIKADKEESRKEN